MDIKEKEQLEIDYWNANHSENPSNFTKVNLLNKMQECRNLDYKISRYIGLIKSKKSVLEIGAGQGWASCFLKKHYLPNARFTTTDISQHAIDSIKYWEKNFDVKIDKYYASKSYEIAEDNEEYDLIFCYAAAHHFVLYEKTLIELKRLVKDNGHIIFFYEPTCSSLFYPIHHYYVNSVTIHSHTPEDVLVPSKIRAICQKIGLKYENHYDAYQVIIRSIPLGVYFGLLRKIPFLLRYLPSSSDLIFYK